MTHFSDIWDQADKESLLDLDGIKSLLNSPDSVKRLRALFHLRRSIKTIGQLDNYFHLAEQYILDKDNDCRWQALISVGEYIKAQPDNVWRIIMKHGDSTDEDMQTAVATVLLEHFFEVHPDLFEKNFPGLKKEIDNGNKNLQNCLAMCRSDFGSKSHADIVANLLRQN